MDSQKRKALVIDDDNEMRSMVSDFLVSRGFEVAQSPNAVDAIDRMTRGDFAEAGVDDPCYNLDVIVSDLNMPDMSGIEFIEKIKKVPTDVPIILVTAFGSIETAIEAIRKGAYDYTTKPFKLSEFGVTVDRAATYRALRKENVSLRKVANEQTSFGQIIGKSPGMREVFDLITRVADASASVLIVGESGTGKERVARAIHDQGVRRGKRFVAINCTAIPDTLLESELFGHAKGAFTGAISRKRGLFEEAEGGTVFLDEIGDMDLGLQAKLLRVLQERKIRAVGENFDRDIDVRIIAASHKDLKKAIKNGSFREDLYYRLAVIPIVIPPLRHRREDIPLLAHHFLKKYARLNSSQVGSISSDAMSSLMSMPWEGNVRELENLIERTVVLCRGKEITIKDLPHGSKSDAESFFEGELAGGTFPTLEDLERRYMKLVLDKTGGRKEKAAQILGINRRTLYRKERDYGFVTADSAEANDDDLS
ncbi:MAG: sigma-54-dependent Fis family transcriptional regulator [Deltaproteobacteria bacterium]|jgi:DNA-binding NtrC family response regulator|nr:sigma-54-dependent Fis family transcriptional regulator [Deltaproteobacteria bacterium]